MKKQLFEAHPLQKKQGNSVERKWPRHVRRQSLRNQNVRHNHYNRVSTERLMRKSVKEDWTISAKFAIINVDCRGVETGFATTENPISDI